MELHTSSYVHLDCYLRGFQTVNCHRIRLCKHNKLVLSDKDNHFSLNLQIFLAEFCRSHAVFGLEVHCETLHCGEYGANWREFSNSSIQKKHDASIRLFHKTINEEAIKRGIIPYVWDINNPNRYGTGGIMCIIDRSKPAVFDQNSLDGIMEGAAAATWGGPTASIRHTVSTTSQSAGQYYTLTGLRVTAGTKGLLIMGGKKIIIK